MLVKNYNIKHTLIFKIKCFFLNKFIIKISNIKKLKYKKEE